ncbi:MAG: (Fe-S)-binding protein [Nitrososphaeria archaeon]
MTEKLYRLEDYREDLQRCMSCGLCRPLCPTTVLCDWESGSPRGQIQLLKAILDGEIRPNKYVASRIYNCTLCGYCLWRCPSAVKTIDSIKAGRALLVEGESHQESLDRLESDLLREHNPFGLPQASRTNWIRSTKVSVPVKAKAEIIYFPGCVATMTEHGMETVSTTASILNAANLDWTVLGDDEWCCGDHLISSGKTSHFKDFVLHNVEAIKCRSAKAVVTSCPRCYRLFSQEYRKLMDDIGFEVFHITQLLDDLISKKKLIPKVNVDLKVAYHDPCELGRLMKVFEPPRRILKAVEGLQLREFTKNRNIAMCCGAGGVFRFTDYDSALKLGARRLSEALTLDVDAVVTACPTCKLNFSEAAHQAGFEVKILDITEVVAASIR